ncbi:P-loop containing nucleoside triphosphate hydrolase protein [Lipomyces doorenjongii]
MVDEALARVSTNFVKNTCKVLFSIAVVSSANPAFILLVVPIAFLYVYYQMVYLRTSRELKRLESVSRSPIYTHFQESLHGVSAIRAYSQMAIQLEFLESMIIVSAALLSILAIASGQLSSGLVGVMSYALHITQSLGSIVRTTVEVEILTVSVDRILEYCKLPCEAPEVIEDNRPQANWPMNGAVEFHDYSTRYRPGLDLVLKGINLTMKPREKIGTVGRTGAGKSSLTLSLFRMIEPVGGFISIDRVTIGLRDLRQRLAIIPQDPQAFEGSVRENLDPGSGHLKNHITSMDGQLLARVNESGSNFSVGQRELIKVLVLDEATAAVDEFKDRTILTIAHRLNTIIDSDRIVVLAAGKVVEFDTPHYLYLYALCSHGGLIE